MAATLDSCEESEGYSLQRSEGDFIAHLHKTTFTSGTPNVNLAVIVTRTRQRIEEPQKSSTYLLKSSSSTPEPIATIPLPGDIQWDVIQHEQDKQKACEMGKAQDRQRGISVSSAKAQLVFLQTRGAAGAVKGATGGEE
ncbi:hypothetical protein SARC_03724 [Sphaeroforma arctica JP610]|uniref:Uncharacterized protein n=1 Tax=Sphaeroforma arctica JP610 TaxID=667725 RepID=A0A0L0G4V8_9EUKA|nr:hypothetical protein SARC_03724 [Sphaeroforma arctica JP610]KNC84062.1 hypothetical protein SARC_03724 [Sphaeroforma arctica JP610]|eukprot:XP_014157964.1 hypothetical protein SARC_03724 [Sphaeroforma arctica JP610]